MNERLRVNVQGEADKERKKEGLACSMVNLERRGGRGRDISMKARCVVEDNVCRTFVSQRRPGI